MNSLLRSTLFMAILIVVTPPTALVIMLCFWLPHRMRRQLVVPWVALANWLIEHLLGIRCRLLGAENIPQQPVVILAKHQSAWETIVLQTVFADTVFVWKKELKWIPFFGWALAVIPSIQIDRGAGKDALNQLVERGKRRLAQGYSVIVFPEGTRVAPGRHRRYKAGGAYLAVASRVPVIPVALNSGEAWGRNSFLKCPGTVTLSIGPAIDPTGLSAEEVNTRVEAWIETEMRRISPNLYRDDRTRPATSAAI